MTERHIDGRALLAHMQVMQGLARKFVEPTPAYVSIGGESSLVPGSEGLEGAQRNYLFANDMLRLLDGPEQRFAESHAGFDYVSEATLTLSNQFHGELVSKANFTKALNGAIEALAQLDKVKKTIFYGRDNNLNPAEEQRDISDLPMMLVASNAGIEGGFTLEEAENYIHGVIGIATEAGELLEAMRDAINGNALDRVNVKEEIGDVKWYAAILAKVARFMWGDDERVNIAKLRARFPERFTEYDANNRNLDNERSILETHLPINERKAKMDGERNLDGEALEAQQPG